MGCNKMSAMICKVLLLAPFTWCQLSFVFSITHLYRSYPYGHLFLPSISSDGSFGCSSCLTLKDIIEPHAKRERSCRSAYVTFTSSKSFPPISHFLPLLTSSSLVILSPWTSGTDGERRSWTLSPLTHLGHRSTSALTSRPSALTKPRLWSRLPVAVNCSGSHGACLWTKCSLESKPGSLYGGRHLFLETMSKYKSAKATDQECEKNVCRKSYLLKYLQKSTQNSLETLYFRFPFFFSVFLFALD